MGWTFSRFLLPEGIKRPSLTVQLVTNLHLNLNILSHFKRCTNIKKGLLRNKWSIPPEVISVTGSSCPPSLICCQSTEDSSRALIPQYRFIHLLRKRIVRVKCRVKPHNSMTSLLARTDRITHLKPTNPLVVLQHRPCPILVQY